MRLGEVVRAAVAAVGADHQEHSVQQAAEDSAVGDSEDWRRIAHDLVVARFGPGENFRKPRAREELAGVGHGRPARQNFEVAYARLLDGRRNVILDKVALGQQQRETRDGGKPEDLA